MPRASKQSLETSVKQEIDSNFVSLLTSLKNERLVSFLENFLTHEEQVMLVKRLAMYTLILEGYSDDTIKEFLKISYESLRVSRVRLEKTASEFKLQLRKSYGSINKKESKIKLLLQSKTDISARARLFSGKD